MLALILACGGEPNAAPTAPGSTPTTQEASVAETVSDPRAYVRQAYLQQPASWAHRADYNLDDPALLDEVIDKAMKTRRRNWNGTLPNDKRELDAFIKISQGMYATAILDTPARRAAVEQKVREHFENPPIAFDGKKAIVDLGWAPGELVQLKRAGWGIGDSDALEQRELRPEIVLRAFRQAVEAHPNASTYEVHVEVPLGTRSMRFDYRFPVSADRLYVRRDGGEVWATRKHAGGVEAFLAGALPTHTSQLVSTVEEARFYEMDP